MKIPRLPDWAKALVFVIAAVVAALLALVLIVMGFITYQCSVNSACF